MEFSKYYGTNWKSRDFLVLSIWSKGCQNIHFTLIRYRNSVKYVQRLKQLYCFFSRCKIFQFDEIRLRFYPWMHLSKKKIGQIKVISRSNTIFYSTGLITTCSYTCFFLFEFWAGWSIFLRRREFLVVAKDQNVQFLYQVPH